MDVIIDDHILLDVLLGDEPEGLREPGARLYTTGLWYHRLCRAVAQPSVVGAMSRRLGDVDDVVASKATEAITTLPNEIGLISLRDLSWSMAVLLPGIGPLNLMSLEALAAAEHLGAGIRLTERGPNPPLVAAAAVRGVQLVLV
jgi:hypothetical protein